MKTIKIHLIIAVISFFIVPVFGQGDLEEKMDKFKAEKITFITNQLNLTSKEAEVFWPVYNEFDAKRQVINKDRMKLAREYMKNGSILSESEASDMADKFIATQKKEALLAEEYNTKFKAVLPASKVLKLYQSELQFKRKLLRQLRQGDGSGHGDKPD